MLITNRINPNKLFNINMLALGIIPNVRKEAIRIKLSRHYFIIYYLNKGSPPLGASAPLIYGPIRIN